MLRFIRSATLALVLCAQISGNARAQEASIDPLVLPAEGIERTYACTSYLNAFSAMLRARNRDDSAGYTLLMLYVSMSRTAKEQAQSQGISADTAQKRMTAWDAAVVTATLTSLKGNEGRFSSNLRECVDIAVTAGKGARAPSEAP